MNNKSSFNYSSVFKILSKGRVSLVVCGMLAANTAFATTYPTNGVVASGSATIAGTATMTVTQTTANAVINWDSFSVSSGNSVAFNGGKATLNRVSASGGLSTIAGTVTGDHALFFVNPNGITVSGTMTAPTLVLSTLDITDGDFNAGTYKFTRGNSTAAITIESTGVIGDDSLAGNLGVAALFATTVQNSGTIQAFNVDVVAADQVVLNFYPSYNNNTYNASSSFSNGIDGSPEALIAASVPTTITNSGTIATSDNGVSGGMASGYININSTNGSIDNTGGNITSFISTDSSFGNGINVMATGDIKNVGGSIYTRAQGMQSPSGNVNVSSSAGTIDNTNGEIYSFANNGSSDTVAVSAGGDIINTGGYIYSRAQNDGSTVDVTSTAGAINNAGGQIYSFSASSLSDAVTVSAHGNINNQAGLIQSITNGSGNGRDAKSGDITVTSTAGSIDNSSRGMISSQGGYSGETGAIVLSAGGDIINTDAGSIQTFTYTGYARSISLTSGGAIDNSGGTILSSANSTQGITLQANGSINNAGLIYNNGHGTTSGGFADDISVISTNGSISNAGGEIYSYASGLGYYSGGVNVKAFGNINNSGGSIYSQIDGANGYIHIGVSVISTDGAINNTGGYIYQSAANGYNNGQLFVSARGDVTNVGGTIFSSGKYGGFIPDGDVYVSSIDGKIDLTNGSIFSDGARATDIYLTAPSIVYNNSSYVSSLSSGSAVTDYGTLYSEGTIRIKTNNLNGTPLTNATTTLASLVAASNTTYDAGSSVWNAKAGNMTLSDLKSLIYGASASSVDYDQTTHSLSNAYGPAIFNSGDLSLSGLVAGRDYKFTENGSDVTGIRNAGTHNIAITMLNSNYGLSNPTATSAFTINKKGISLAEGSTFTADNKVYNGTTATTAHASFDGVYSGDIVTAAGAFDTKEVGTDKTVTLVLAGADGGNYTTNTRFFDMNTYQWVTTVVNHTTTANITAAPIQVEQQTPTQSRTEIIKANLEKVQQASRATQIINTATNTPSVASQKSTASGENTNSSTQVAFGAPSAPKANSAQGFMVGRDITGGGNAMAYSTIIPGIFVVAD